MIFNKEMTMMEIVSRPLIGGVIIAFTVSLMLLMNGRVTGISGIVRGLLSFKKDDTSWRVAFFLGLVMGGFFISRFISDVFLNESQRNLPQVALAGILVGFGTAMSNGCTSGHGVCGISRLSIRSLIATVTFISFGVLSVFLIKRIF